MAEADPRKRDLIVAWLRDMNVQCDEFTIEGLADTLLTFLYRHGAGVYIAKVKQEIEELKSSPVNGFAEIDRPTLIDDKTGERTPLRSVDWFDDAALGPKGTWRTIHRPENPDRPPMRSTAEEIIDELFSSTKKDG